MESNPELSCYFWIQIPNYYVFLGLFNMISRALMAPAKLYDLLRRDLFTRNFTKILCVVLL